MVCLQEEALNRVNRFWPCGANPEVVALGTGEGLLSGERTHPVQQRPERPHRKTVFGETPNPTRGTRMLPRRFGAGNFSGNF
jgi:hypothetical protein